MTPRTALLSVLVLAIGMTPLTPQASTAGATGIVASISNAPVVPDGDVAGSATDVLITLDGSLDPNVAGRSLLAGRTISVVFPPAFDLGNIDPAYPLNDVPFPFPPVPPLPPQPCVPGNLQCTTAVVLRGWPQDPLFPPRLFTTLQVDHARNALVFTAAQNIEQSPGIKQLHLILNGVTNPAAGQYRIRVEAETGPNGSLETGEALLEIRERAAPSINITSVFVPALGGAEGDAEPVCGPPLLPPLPNNPVYQTTATGEAAGRAWSFLLWGADREPLDNVSLEPFRDGIYLLRRDDGGRSGTVVGTVQVEAPPGATGQEVYQINCPSLMPAAPVIGATPGIGPQPVGRMDLRFVAGDVAGVYKARLSLREGNTVTMVVTAD
ncbi:MAG: hypothetical protein AAGM16_01020 [Pseudomonadota bacterium]